MNCLVILVGAILCSSAFATFYPPVNTPNDCTIQCIRAPCPCGATCPQLSCPKDCKRWQTDKRNCNTCKCAEEHVDKPGQCPAPIDGMVGICIAECTDDADCPGSQKCCGNCPRRCTEPEPVEKPGQCPPPSGAIGPCVVRCSGDDSCPGDQKCCGSCPRDCTAPVAVKDDSNLVCPSRFLRFQSHSSRGCGRYYHGRSSCFRDSDCSAGKLCCGSCLKRCVRGERRLSSPYY